MFGFSVFKKNSMLFLSPCFHFRLKICFRNYVPFTMKSSKKFLIFDQNVKKKQRLRAALDKTEAKKANYLKEEVAKRLVERLMFIKKKTKVIFDFGSGAGHIASCLSDEKNNDQFLGKIERLIMADVSEDIFDDDNLSNIRDFIVEKVCLNNEIPSFSENSIDIVITNLYMHWINDLPGLLKQIKYILVPDGVFLGSMFGGDTLFELRTSLQLAEQERKGGISARVSPMAGNIIK